jgi:hypothetical protein
MYIFEEKNYKYSPIVFLTVHFRSLLLDEECKTNKKYKKSAERTPTKEITSITVQTCNPKGWSVYVIEEGRAPVKVLIKNLAIFFLFPRKKFLPISFKIQLLETSPQKQEEQRQKQLGADKLVVTQIWKHKNLMFLFF